MNRWVKPATAIFLLLCAGWYWYSTVADVTPHLVEPSDFRPYQEAARDLLSGQSPFITRGYIYPPLLAFLLTPVAPLSYPAGRWIWYLFSQACLLAAAWLMWRAMGRDRIAACAIALVWAVGGAANESLGLGQLGPPLALVLALAYTQRGWRQTGALAAGAGLKLIPAALGFIFLLTRQWRAIATLVCGSLTLLALPWLFVACCLSGPKTPAGTDTWTGTPAILSWSLPSIALRIADSPSPDGPLPRNWEFGNDLPNLHLPPAQRALSIGVFLLTLAAGVIVLATAFKHGLDERQAPFAMAGLLSLCLAASPVSWSHYQVMQYPGAALLLGHAWRSRQWKLLGWSLAFSALLYPAPAEILRYLAMKDGSWKLISHAALYGWTSVPAVGCVALFALLVREAKRLKQ